MLWTMCALPDHVEMSKQAIRDHAMAFSKKWADATSEAGEKQLFWNDFFAIFGVSLKNVGFFEVIAERLSTKNHGWIDFLMPGRMGVEHKSAGKDLDEAMGQLLDYWDSLKPTDKPSLLVACNFQHFYWKDLEAHTEGSFDLEDLSKNVELFWWLAGHGTHEALEDEEEANLVATGYMATLYDAVRASGYDDHSLREWLTRILFCLFADDTEVWDRNAFSNYIYLHTRQDGSDLGQSLSYLFQILNTPDEDRAKNLDEDLAVFTYINGDVFETVLSIPTCNESTRDALLEACKFNWSAISPAIFGSMFQNVMTPAERRHLGAHYTTEENILKTIKPLFLDELEDELDKLRTTARSDTLAEIDKFHDKLASLTFLDPACGCGNFLVIAYRELRRLETGILRKRALASKQSTAQVIDVGHLLKVTVGQFYGIELEEFPARIARTALYLMDHKANLEVSKEFGQYFARFPIPTSPHIVIDNALRMDWDSVLPADKADFVFGNPPFVGMYLMNEEQHEDNAIIFEDPSLKITRSGRLDYVACWYGKSVLYAGTRPIRFAFVSTNSITQGEQARSLQPFLMAHGYSVDFAHRTFAWSSEAKGTAHVHVVIVGFSKSGSVSPKRLFEYPEITSDPIEHPASNINFYLTDAPDVVIGKQSRPFMPLPLLVKGSQPTDAGHLIVEPEDRADVLADPIASKYLRRLIGARGMLNNESRWCLWLVGANPQDLRNSPVLRQRLAAVATWRSTVSKTASVRALASVPALFTQIRQPSTRYLCIPRHSSENRRIIPMAMFEAEDIAHDSTLALSDPPMWLVGVLQSAMWMAWVRTVCGRLKSDIRVDPDLAYYAYPFGEDLLAKRDQVEACTHAMFAVRDEYPEDSLADLYDSLATPPTLVKAHDDLDRSVDSMFAPRRRKRFESDADRLGLLFERYEKLSAPLLADK